MFASLLALSLFTGSADASSHREAPAIALDPAADTTDLYMFLNPSDPSKLVLILNVVPLQEPGGGPNFYRFDENVLYEINIDNEGDGEADIQYAVQFETDFRIPDTFLYNVGPIDDRANLNIVQRYSVTRYVDGQRQGTFRDGFVAPSNVGVMSTPEGAYQPASTMPGTITTDHIFGMDVHRVFAGQRQEGFYIDLERTFDLLNIDQPGNVNTLLGLNVHSIAIEVPVEMVTRDGQAPHPGNQVIAAWGSTSRRAVTVRPPNRPDSRDRGQWVQVSRLGNPLFNEVINPIALKDDYNRSEPGEDVDKFVPFVLNPILGDLLETVLGVEVPEEADLGLGLDGREDLYAVFLTGVEALGTLPQDFALGAPIPGEPGKRFAAFEAMRINLASSPEEIAWPNGRMPGDDVVDTALSAVAGLLVDGSTLSDGVDASGLFYLDVFPFLGDPWFGDAHPRAFHDLDEAQQ